MKTCPVCGKQSEDRVRFCSECGSRFPEAVVEPVVPVRTAEEPAAEEPAAEPLPELVPDPAPAPEIVFEPAPEAPAPETPVWDAPAAEPAQQQVWDQPAPAYEPTPAYVPAEPVVRTKKEFLKLPENKKLKKNLNAAAIIAYISAALTLVLTLPTGYIDVVTIIAILLTVAAGVLLQTKQSRVAAIVLLAFALINTIYSLIVLGQPGGWLLILAGVYAVMSTFQLEKLWKKYKAERGV